METYKLKTTDLMDIGSLSPEAITLPTFQSPHEALTHSILAIQMLSLDIRPVVILNPEVKIHMMAYWSAKTLCFHSEKLIPGSSSLEFQNFLRQLLCTCPWF